MTTKKKQRRKKLSQHTISDLLLFYGGKSCIVTGELHHDCNSWSHVDEDSEISEFHNLVPLRADLNAAIEAQRKNRVGNSYVGRRSWPAQLEADFLWNVAHEHFKYGRYAHGFGCHITGAYLALKRLADPDFDLALQCTAHAIDHLRALGRIDLISSTIRHYALPAIKEGTKKDININLGYGMLATTIAAMYQDLGDKEEFGKWAKVARAILKMCKGTRGDRARLRLNWKKFAMTCTLAEHIDPPSTPAKHSSDWSNYRQWTSRYWLRKNDKKKAIKHVKEVIGVKKILPLNSPKIQGSVTVWTYAEMLVTVAQCRTRSDSVNKYMAQAWGVFKEFRISPTLLDGIGSAVVVWEEKNIKSKQLWLVRRKDKYDACRRSLCETLCEVMKDAPFP